jgi:chloramphenicol-sensitive protein RarD
LNTSGAEWQGYAFSVGASILFGIIPWYLQFLLPLSGNLLFGHRLVVQVFCAFIILLLTKQLTVLNACLRSPRQLGILLLTSPLVAVQWWVFFWAPVNGFTVDMAMGYFLLPLTMALTGMLVFREKMRPLQWLALLVAVAGVGVELRSVGTFSWVTLVVCLGYPPYFILRRRLPLETRVNFAAENLLLLPVGLVLVAMAANAGEQLVPDRNYGLFLLFGAGALGTVAMLMFVAAAARLSFTVFGLLGYLEPVLLMAVALLVLRETISTEQAASYTMFTAAIVLVFFDGCMRWKRKTLVRI